MKLVASLIVRNEAGRYLEHCIGHLLEFCDEVRVVDDNSDDGTAEWLLDQRKRGVRMRTLEGGSFFDHEGYARQQLYEYTVGASGATHVLAIDADEFVSDGAALRASCVKDDATWTLDMEEVWELDGDCLCVRVDGGWRPHPVTMVYTVGRESRGWRIQERALACGRVPVEALSRRPMIPVEGVEVLHFGWANEEARQARYDRYVMHDGGRFHASQHLLSIMWPDDRVRLVPLSWPVGLEGHREAIVASVNERRRST